MRALIDLYDSLSPLFIVGAYLLGSWRATSRDAIGQAQSNPPRSRIEDAAGRVN